MSRPTFPDECVRRAVRPGGPVVGPVRESYTCFTCAQWVVSVTKWTLCVAVDQDGATPLTLAVRGSHDNSVKALIAAGVDVSGPLYHACLHGDTPIVKMLLSAPEVNTNLAQPVS